MHDWAVIDFETQSACDLKKSGAEKYAECATTKVLCLAYAWPEGGVTLWKPGQPLPNELLEHVARGGTVVAHNVGFEFSIWNLVLCGGTYGPWPQLALEQLDDTMPRARAMSLPGGLGECAEALRLPVRKDKDGHRAMMKISRPRTRDPLTFWTEETAREDFERVFAYCPIDVEVGRELHRVLPPLPPQERKIWLLDQRINQRGVPLDIPNARRALGLIDIEKAELSARVFDKTGGASTATQRDALLAWLQSEGVEISGLTKADVAKAVADPKLEGTAAKAVLQIRREAAKSSTSKLTAMVASAGRGGRARGLFQYWGAGPGRWAGRRLQTQNLARPGKGFKHSDAEAVINFLSYSSAGPCIRFEYGSVMDALSWSLRAFICAEPGKRFITADFSNIQGRGLAWMADETWKLEAFRRYDTILPGFDSNGEPLRAGPDLYKLAYSKSFGVPVEEVADDGRQIGKVQELALGFSGGIGSFISMAAGYGIVPEQIAAAVKAVTSLEDWNTAYKRLPKMGTKFRYGLDPEVWTGLRVVVDAWRKAHPRTVQLWRALEDAAVEAVEYPGQVTSAGGHIRYKVDGDFLKCRLPSGRCIHYPYPEMKRFPSVAWEGRRDELKYLIEHPVDELGEPLSVAELRAELADHEAHVQWEASLTYWGVSSKAGSSKKWKPQRLYGGLQAENCDMGIERDCLAQALLRLEEAGYPIVLHSHDESGAEVDDGFGSLEEYSAIMCATEDWAAGLPVVAAGWQGMRYRK